MPMGTILMSGLRHENSIADGRNQSPVRKIGALGCRLAGHTTLSGLCDAS